MKPYRAPWYLGDGLAQTLIVGLLHGNAWQRFGSHSPLAPRLPVPPYREQIFGGAEGVPLAGQLARQPGRARGTLILCYGITGSMETSWYNHYLASKAFARGYDVVLYDWRGHGKSAELSPVPPSDGWRDGADIVQIAAQAVAEGCRRPVIAWGCSLGGQIVLWALKAAQQLKSPDIAGAVAVCPNLESNWSLANLRRSWKGQLIEDALVRELRQEVSRRLVRYPELTPAGVLEKLHLIRDFDEQLVISYYGFASVEQYYQRTSGLYLLPELTLPHLILYAQDDPMFDGRIVVELEQRAALNPRTQLVLTEQGGHGCYIGAADEREDEFWALNRTLEFCDELSCAG
ncbi:YheT family hydrolase [Gloeobacter kilaueensis]|uniref:Alpha/beta hydrolase fold protein n=1 Tax=Gloeobacter kilaueensis (strain ATCC BAA-2537 / CCAP 1431/1 / ULC 316 / JS1) TaxID=1183438 RepID=U5QG55_GLOK1|nr:alpha/beta fold hydrolase [Gloeobacter kilaueensis]AGY57838.1 alpha/beta hydrolase fold protein [Gloeobacter kilaueensis JS1]